MAQSADEIKLDETNLFLFVGPADGGKSFAATSWGFKSKKYGGTDDRPAYLLELDGRIAALRNNSSGKPRPIVFDRYTNADGAIGVLKRVETLRNNAVRDNSTPYHTLIFDSFTAFNDFALADSLDITKQKNEGNNDSEGGKGRKRGELQLPTIEEYGYEAESWRQLMYEHLLDLKKYCDVIVIAHEVESYKNVKTKPGEPTRTEPDGYKILAHGNKISARIPTKFDEIYHFLAKEVVLSMKTVRRQVVFQDKLARSSYPQLCKTTDAYDITDKEFYLWWREMISK